MSQNNPSQTQNACGRYSIILLTWDLRWQEVTRATTKKRCRALGRALAAATPEIDFFMARSDRRRKGAGKRSFHPKQTHRLIR